jgi:membrane fusion protein, heavy metal efflux system
MRFRLRPRHVLVACTGLIALGLAAAGLSWGMNEGKAGILPEALLARFGVAESSHADGGTRPAAAPSDGSIQLAANEWRNLVVEPVAARAFRPQFTTEGKIATDEDHATPVLSPYAGKVIRILVKPGDMVRAGQVLCTIEATDMVAAQNDFVAATSALEKARTALRLAEINERRQRDLYNGRAAPLRDLEQAQADFKSAQADERSAIAALGAVENRLRILGKTAEDIHQLRERGTINPETAILAPISGLVAQRKVGPGQFVQGSGGDALFLVDDTSSVWLQAFVREGDSTAVDVGDEIQFRVLARPDETYSAVINHVSPLLDANTRRLMVRASIPNPRGTLRREMFASVTIFTEAASDWPAVPRRAVIRQGEKSHVWLVTGEGRVTLREIRTGLVQNRFVQVLDGLASGDRIVVQGSLFLDQMAAEGR